MTNSFECDIILKLLARATETASWKLNNIRKKYNDPWNSFVIKMKESQEKDFKNTSNKCVSIWNEQDNKEYLCSLIYNFYKEFDPGSGRTLAARLTHASRTEMIWVYLDHLSGGRVSNTWATCLWERDSFWKRMVIPHNIQIPHGDCIKDSSLKDGLASD